MTKFCKLCGLDALEPGYGRDTKSVSTIYICEHYGLAQSHLDDVAQGVFASFDAQSESAKKLRVTSTVAFMRDHVDLSQPMSVLDVGAVRGAFVREFLSAAPRARITAVEPNVGQAWACAFQSRSDIISKPIEETQLPREYFDAVHSCRTIEHLDSPLAACRT